MRAAQVERRGGAGVRPWRARCVAAVFTALLALPGVFYTGPSGSTVAAAAESAGRTGLSKRAARLGSLLREVEARDAKARRAKARREAAGQQAADKTSDEDLKISFQDNGGKKTVVSSPLKIFILLTILSLAPALLVMMTAFTRIIVVMGFMRHALSTQQIPPNIVLIGLALFLTLFVMAPTFTRVNDEALQPYLDGTLGRKEALAKGLTPLREFMGKQTRKEDLSLFLKLTKVENPKSFEEVPTTALVPAFVLSELRTAFQMGFLIFLPFVIIDLVVASILMSLGMVMLPPAMVSLPMKILLFVLADGWTLVVKSLVLSFG